YIKNEYKPSEVLWSLKGSYIAIMLPTNEKNLSGNSMYKIQVYDTMNGKNVYAINEAIDIYKFYWIDDKSILVNEVSGQTDAFYIHDVSIKAVNKDVTKEQGLSIVKSLEEKSNTENKHILSEQQKQQYGQQVDSTVFEGIISEDKQKVLFNTEGYKIYLLDTNINNTKYIASGFLLEWSSTGKFIKYCLPKDFDEANYREVNTCVNLSSDMLDTYIYDIENEKSVKVSDFHSEIYFSPDDSYLLYVKVDYEGLKSL
ncbi:MAG: hypothetical protein ACOZCL_06635, partial [Bacillota bacterium]